MYDGANRYADFDGSGTVTERYLYGPAVDMIMARLDSQGDVACYLTDHLGSLRDLADTAGQVIDHIQYDSFGNVLSETNPAEGDRFKFTAREFDAAIGLYYYRARYYDPAVGRFISEDPIGFQAGDANLYRYVENNPITQRDPAGLAKLMLLEHVPDVTKSSHAAVVVTVPVPPPAAATSGGGTRGGVRQTMATLVLSFEGDGWNVYDYQRYVRQKRFRNIWVSDDIPGTDDLKVFNLVMADPTRYSFTHTNCYDRADAALRAGGMGFSIRRPTNVRRLMGTLRAHYGLSFTLIPAVAPGAGPGAASGSSSSSSSSGFGGNSTAGSGNGSSASGSASGTGRYRDSPQPTANSSGWH